MIVGNNVSFSRSLALEYCMTTRVHCPGEQEWAVWGVGVPVAYLLLRFTISVRSLQNMLHQLADLALVANLQRQSS